MTTGLSATTLIIVGERADDFDAPRADLLEEYEPRSSLEIELVERLAGILWRLRRVPLFEAAIVDSRHAGLESWQLNRIYKDDSEGGTST
jgi:hypothetical protein